MVKCKVCGKEFESDRQLHAHLKAHKMRVIEYYQSQYPRYDKFDNTIIKFKSKDQYFASDFNTRTNLKKWIKSAPKDEVKEYCENLLIDRKNKKNMPKYFLFSLVGQWALFTRFGFMCWCHFNEVTV